MRKLPEHEVRDRLRPLRVVVSQAERREIESRAAAASLSVSAYLRAVSSDIRNPSIGDTENPSTSATVMPRRMPVRMLPLSTPNGASRAVDSCRRGWSARGCGAAGDPRLLLLRFDRPAPHPSHPRRDWT
jgi:hypothetical protein